MTKIDTASLNRRDLDKQLKKFRAARIMAKPHVWLRNIREALGMTSAQLARRIGISQSALSQMEHSEQRGTISLNTLRKAAAGLDADLVYAIVPRKTLNLTLELRLIEIARRELNAEDPRFQYISAVESYFIAERRARSIDPKRAWEEEK